MFKRYSNTESDAPLAAASTEAYTYKQLRRLGLSDSAARQAYPHAKVRSFSAEEKLYRRGEPTENLYMMVSGFVAGQFFSSERQTSIIDVFGSGAWFGEFMLIDALQSPLDFVCLTDADVMAIAWPLIRQLLTTDPSMGAGLANLATLRAQSLTERLVLIRQGSACAKVILGLALLAESVLKDRGLGVNVRLPSELPFSQQGLAEICGVSRSVFSGFVTHLQRLELATLHYGKVELLQRSKWDNLLKVFRQSAQFVGESSVEAFFDVNASLN